jgi:hypothetical protein
MTQNLLIQTNNWPAIYWIRWSRSGNSGSVNDPAVARYKRFSYGSLLLAYRATANRFQYGGPWAFDRPDQLYFWNWGQPVSLPSSVNQLAAPGEAGLYRREFSNGLILVNASNEPITSRLEGTFYDVSAATKGSSPAAVQSVTIGAADAAFLLSRRP